MSDEQAYEDDVDRRFLGMSEPDMPLEAAVSNLKGLLVGDIALDDTIPFEAVMESCHRILLARDTDDGWVRVEDHGVPDKGLWQVATLGGTMHIATTYRGKFMDMGDVIDEVFAYRPATTYPSHLLPTTTAADGEADDA